MCEGKYKINICHLYPDVLNLYGDSGNIIAMKQRLAWRGIECKITEAPIGSKLDSREHDIFFIGGGQDFEQEILLRDAREHKQAEIKKAIEEEKVLLAICGGYQLLGNYYKTWQGKEYPFMACLDLYTEGHKDRMTGNIMFTCDDIPGQEIVGFENHSGRTYLGKELRPWGKVLYGHGNNGEDQGEGARYKNVFATYSHGPILPKNPKICDLILNTALERKYGNIELINLEDDFENKAHEYMVNRLSQNKKNRK